jgi:hypothetical protein
MHCRIIPYNRKINAPIRFLYYLEVFDLFIIMVAGFLVPLGVSSFLPVVIPIWHIALWLVALTTTLILIKIGRAPGFIQHWLTQVFRPLSYHPGKRRQSHFLLNEAVYRGEVETARNREQPFAPEDLEQIRANVRQLRHARREAELLSSETSLQI